MPATFSLNQIIQQLRTQWGGSWEGTTESWGGSGAITYFIGGTPYASGSGEAAYTVTMTSQMQSRAALAFELWDDLIARDLNQAFSAAYGQIQFEYASRTYNSNGVLSTNGGTYSGSWGSSSGTGPYGTTNYNISRNEIWLNSNWSSHNADNDMYFGGYGFQTYMHEIGHSLGLSHPGTYDAGSGGSITYAANAEYTLDNRQYTIMSYFGGYAPGAGWQQDGTYSNWLYSSTPMLHDIAAIQAIYGADMTTRAGDTTYGFHSNAGRDVFDFTIDTNPIVAVWDAGGTDTLDFSGYSANQRIDLRAGTYSDVGAMLSNFAIAYNVVIENAIGGSGSDTIIVNGANNTIDGGAGIDYAVFSGARANYTLTALAGNSVRVVGPDGTDTLTNVERLVFTDQTVNWPPPVDLVASNVSLANTSIPVGASTIASYTLTNAGAGTSAASTVGIYRSLDSVFDASDVLVMTRAIPSLGSGVSIVDNFWLTASVAGTFYLFAVADYNNAIAEGNETNNAATPAQYTTAAPQTTNGDSNPNTLNGSPFDDIINGLGGNDVIAGGYGNDTVDGGPGTDTAVFAGTFASYKVIFYNGEIGVLAAGSEGRDRLFNIENLQFADRTIAATSAQAFHPLDYIASHPDLRAAFHTSAQAGFDHYVDHGFTEGRQVTFSGLEYIASYVDLIRAFGTNGDAGAVHYIDHGISEGRRAAFDGLQYIASYGDLINAFGHNEDAGTSHYIGHGYGEGRHATFDAASYLSHYADLRAAFGNDAHAATLHWIDHGFAEGRTWM